MRKITLLILFYSVLSFTQKKEKFEPSVKIIENELTKKITNLNLILFEFLGDTHLINNYLNLSKEIKKRFRKKGIKTKFNYKLSSSNPLKEDLESIPLKEYYPKNFKNIIVITLSWDYPLLEERKQAYKINFFVKDKAKIVFDVKTYYTISTQNKKISELLLSTLLE